MLTDTIMLYPPVSIVSQFSFAALSKSVNLSLVLFCQIWFPSASLCLPPELSDAKWSIKIGTSFSQLLQAYSSQKLACWCLHWTVPKPLAAPSQQLTIAESGRMWGDWAMPGKIVQHWIIKSCCEGPGHSQCPSVNRLSWDAKWDQGPDQSIFRIGIKIVY